jgi:hypothetical protein
MKTRRAAAMTSSAKTLRAHPKPRSSMCWQCGRKLGTRIDPKRGRVFIFELWTDKIGNVHAVHKICKQNLDTQGWGNPYPPANPMEPDPMRTSKRES